MSAIGVKHHQKLERVIQDRMAAISEIIQPHKGGLTCSEIQKVLCLTHDLSISQLRSAVNRLEKSGYVRSSKRGVLRTEELRYSNVRVFLADANKSFCFDALLEIGFIYQPRVDKLAVVTSRKVDMDLINYD